MIFKVINLKKYKYKNVKLEKNRIYVFLTNIINKNI